MTEGPHQPGQYPDNNQQSGQPSQQSGYPAGYGQPSAQTGQQYGQGQYAPTSQYSNPYAQHQQPGYPGQQPGGVQTIVPPSAPARRPSLGALAAVGVAIALFASLLSVTGAYLVWGNNDSSSVSVSNGAAPAAAAKGSVQEVAQNVLPAVVSIDNQAGSQESSGSGVVMTADGKIVTNNHVVAGNGKLTVSFSDGSTSAATVVGTDPVTDLAVIQSNKRDLKPITFTDSSKVAVGQDVVAVGAPLGLAGTVTSGIVSALNRPVATSGKDSDQATVINSIQTDAAINPGNSGGALVDMAGRLIGINSSIASLGSAQGQQSGSIGLGFAIPSNQVQRIAKELIDSGKATHAAVGVQVDPRQASAATPGAVITDVSATGAFGRAGIPKGALVTKVDSLALQNGYALIGAVRAYPPGATVTITYVESGSSTPQTKQVTLDRLNE